MRPDVYCTRGVCRALVFHVFPHGEKGSGVRVVGGPRVLPVEIGWSSNGHSCCRSTLWYDWVSSSEPVLGIRHCVS